MKKQRRSDYIPNTTTKFKAYDEKGGEVEVPFDKLKDSVTSEIINNSGIDLILQVNIGTGVSTLVNIIYEREDFVWSIYESGPGPNNFWVSFQPGNNRIQYVSTHIAEVLSTFGPIPSGAFPQLSLGAGQNTFWSFTNNGSTAGFYIVFKKLYGL